MRPETSRQPFISMIAFQPEHFAVVTVRILSVGHCSADSVVCCARNGNADRHVNLAIASEGDFRGRRAGNDRVGRKNVADLAEPITSVVAGARRKGTRRHQPSSRTGRTTFTYGGFRNLRSQPDEGILLRTTQPRPVDVESIYRRSAVTEPSVKFLGVRKTPFESPLV